MDQRKKLNKSMEPSLEKKLQSLIEMGVSVRRASHAAGISLVECMSFIAENNISIIKRKFSDTAEELEFIKLAHNNGASVHALSKDIYNISTSRMAKKLASLNLEKKFDASIHSYNEDIFDNIDSEAKAYWLGYIFADGTNQFKSLNFRIAEEKLKHIKALAEFIGDDPNRIKIDDKYAIYKIYSKTIFEKLNKLGLISPKPESKFPTIEASLYHHFLRGYLDGKGSISQNEKTRECKFTMSGNENILNNIIANVPLDLKISTNSSGYKQIVISGNIRFINFCEWLYKDSTIYLDVRCEKLKSIKERLVQ